MQAMGAISSTLSHLPAENVDTDQIIPARFLTTTTRKGLGRHCFNDWRYDAKGREREDFPLAGQAMDGNGILLAGRNFGCGSSREHAPWALLDYGVRVLISTRIADIFRSNALKNGLLAIEVSVAEAALLEAQVGEPVTVDLERQRIVLPQGVGIAFAIDGFARECLLRGVDQLGYLLAERNAIARYEQACAA